MGSTELLRVTDIKYESKDDLIVTIVGRGQDGRRVAKNVYGAEPYFFVATEEARLYGETVADIIEYLEGYDDEAVVVDVRDGYTSYDDVELLQIVTKYPKGVRKLRDAFDDTYEDDIPFVRRCTADYKLSGYIEVPTDSNIFVTDVVDRETSEVDSIDPRVCIVDIEVESPDVFTDDFAEEAPNKVTAVTAWDSYEDDYVLFCLDPEHLVDPAQVREYLESHWTGEDTDNVDEIVDKDTYINADIVFKRFGDEFSLLESFIGYIQERRPDLVTGWNYVNFDHEYLVNRIRNIEDLNVHALSDIGSVGGWRTDRYVPGLPAVDMMRGMKKVLYGQRASWSLDYISHHELGIGKVSDESNAYDKDRSMYMAYNIVDVQLCVALDKAKAVIEFWCNLADICSIPIYDVGSEMKEVEGVLFKLRTHNEILPSTSGEELDEISGGLVLPPSDGVESWVGVFDLKSLYPSSIITCNISKETMTHDPEEADIIVPDVPLNYAEVGRPIQEEDIGWDVGKGRCVGFTLDKQGILPKYIKLLFKERDRLKKLRNEYDPSSGEYDRYDNQQYAVKVLMNSFFGVSDNEHFRLAADGLGEAITSASRYVSWYGIKEIENQGYKVHYGDTDSIFVSMAAGENGDDLELDELVDRGDELRKDINAGLHPIADDIGIPREHPYLEQDLHGTERHCWVYEFEKLYRRFFQYGKKKRYAGYIVWKEGKEVDTVDLVGLETQRADATVLTRRVQKEFLGLVLGGAGFEECSEYIQTEAERLKRGEYPVGVIGFPASINKPIEEYPNRPVKRAVLYTNEHIDGYDWQVDDDPWLVYVSKTPYRLPPIDVIALDWTDTVLPDGFELDVEEHLRKTIRKPLSRIIDSLPWNWEELRTGRQEQAVIGDDSGGVPTFEESPKTTLPSFDDGEEDAPKRTNSAFDW